MRSVRRAFMAGLWAAMLVTTPSIQARIAARSGEPPAAVAARPRDFDFLVGRWVASLTSDRWNPAHLRGRHPANSLTG